MAQVSAIAVVMAVMVAVCLVDAVVVSGIKLGFCPRPKPGVVGVCVVECTRDTECTGNMKCCGGCPRKCVKPVQCPISRRPCIVGEKDSCKTSNDCKGTQMCCNKGISCARACMEPVTLE